MRNRNGGIDIRELAFQVTFPKPKFSKLKSYKGERRISCKNEQYRGFGGIIEAAKTTKCKADMNNQPLHDDSFQKNIQKYKVL